MTAPRIAKVAKGKRPIYFADPATDKLMAIVLTLVGELSVCRDRIDALERVLESSGALDRNDVDGFAPNEQASQERAEHRAAYIARVMRVVTMELQRTDDDGATDNFTATLASMLESTTE